MGGLTNVELRARYEVTCERVKSFATAWLDGAGTAAEVAEPLRDEHQDLSTSDFTAHLAGYFIARLLAHAQSTHGIDGRALWQSFLADRFLQDTATRPSPPGDAS